MPLYGLYQSVYIGQPSCGGRAYFNEVHLWTNGTFPLRRNGLQRNSCPRKGALLMTHVLRFWFSLSEMKSYESLIASEASISVAIFYL